MKSFYEILSEINSLSEKNTILEKYSDKSTVDEFQTQQEIVKILKLDKNVKKHIGKQSIYFDGSDLVLGDKTVKRDLLSKDGWDPDTTIGDLKKLLLKMPAPKSKSAAAAPGEDLVGRFSVKLPSQLAGSHGSAPTDLKNPRAIIKADDDEAKMLKAKLHSSKNGIKVRIMKRKTGNQVYIDAKDGDAFNSMMDILKKL
jgi:hypothetical protein